MHPLVPHARSLLCASPPRGLCSVRSFHVRLRPTYGTLTIREEHNSWHNLVARASGRSSHRWSCCPTTGGGGVKFRTRNPWDSAWGSAQATFTVNKPDADILAKLVGNQDASYQRSTLDAIDATDFHGTNPNEVNEEAVAREVEARCAQLDIERAKAANVQQEFILDHSRDKHITADVPGCPSCEAKVIPSAPIERSSDDLEEELPF